MTHAHPGNRRRRPRRARRALIPGAPAGTALTMAELR